MGHCWVHPCWVRCAGSSSFDAQLLWMAPRAPPAGRLTTTPGRMGTAHTTVMPSNVWSCRRTGKPVLHRSSFKELHVAWHRALAIQDSRVRLLCKAEAPTPPQTHPSPALQEPCRTWMVNIARGAPSETSTLSAALIHHSTTAAVRAASAEVGSSSTIPSIIVARAMGTAPRDRQWLPLQSSDPPPRSQVALRAGRSRWSTQMGELVHGAARAGLEASISQRGAAMHGAGSPAGRSASQAAAAAVLHLPSSQRPDHRPT